MYPLTKEKINKMKKTALKSVGLTFIGGASIYTAIIVGIEPIYSIILSSALCLTQATIIKKHKQEKNNQEVIKL